MGSIYTTIPPDGYTCAVAASLNDTSAALCSGRGSCDPTGACSCEYFYDPLNFCNRTYYEATSPDIIISYLLTGYLLVVLYLAIYLTELTIDCRRIGFGVFRRTGIISKMAIITYGGLNVTSYTLFALGYAYQSIDGVFYATVSYVADIVGVAVLLAAHSLCSIRWYELVLRAENLNDRPRWLRPVRTSLIVILAIVFPLVLTTSIIASLPGASSAAKSAGTYVYAFAAFIGFGTSTGITSVYLIKSVAWLRSVASVSASEKVYRLYVKSIVLIIANLVVLGNFVWSLIGALALPGGSMNAKTRDMFVSMLLGNILAWLLFGFLQNHWVREPRYRVWPCRTFVESYRASQDTSKTPSSKSASGSGGVAGGSSGGSSQGSASTISTVRTSDPRY